MDQIPNRINGAYTPESHYDTSPKQVLMQGRYAIGEQIARGGTCVVRKAFDNHLEMPLAAKIVRDDNLKDNPDLVRRLELEAKTMANISHPGIVKVYEFARTKEGSGVLFMEYIDSPTLKEHLKAAGSLTFEQSANCLKQVASAIDYAYSRYNVLHRDIKPSNIFLTPDHAKIGDFGLASSVVPTSAGGTILYMSPERFFNEDSCNLASETFSLASVAYEMLTGFNQFRLDLDDCPDIISAMYLIAAIKETNGLSLVALTHLTDCLASKGLSVEKQREVSAILCKAQSADPSNRYQTTSEFAKALSCSLEI